MGDTRSWLIFLAGLLAVVLFAIALLIALLLGLGSLLKRWSNNRARKLNEAGREVAPSSTPGDPGAYNVMTDTVTGVNARKSDNLFQAIFILVAVLLATAVGTVTVLLNHRWGVPWYGGAMLGAFAGLLIGVFASGAILMVYRALSHLPKRDK